MFLNLLRALANGSSFARRLNISHLTTSFKYVNSNNPFNDVQLTTVRTLQGGGGGEGDSQSNLHTLIGV